MRMDEKHPVLPITEHKKNDDAAALQERPRWRADFKALFASLSITLLLYLIVTLLPNSSELSLRSDNGHYVDPAKPKSEAPVRMVPLEAHIMSKCPDARDCLRLLIVPAMANLSEKVDFRLSYIGQPTNHDDGVSCKHGPSECLGDILELCAASLYPSTKTYLGFTMCMSESYRDIPSRTLVEDCAMEHGIDFDKLNDCATKDDGTYAMDMLRKSVEHSTARNVTISCTVRLDEKVWCIRDGGEWKDCKDGHEVKDLVRDIDKVNSAVESS